MSEWMKVITTESFTGSNLRQWQADMKGDFIRPLTLVVQTYGDFAVGKLKCFITGKEDNESFTLMKEPKKDYVKEDARGINIGAQFKAIIKNINGSVLLEKEFTLKRMVSNNNYIYRGINIDTIYSIGNTTKVYIEIHYIPGNIPPEISGIDKNLGEISDEINYEYMVSDIDGDTLSIVERLNNEIITTRNNVESGSAFTVNISREKLYSLELNVENILEIEVSDGKERIYRKIRFTRTNTAPEIEIISGVEALENLTIPPTIKYRVIDPEKDKVNIEVKLNGKIIYVKEDIILDESMEYTIPNKEWILLQVAEHELIIEARDAEGGFSQKKIKFTRTEDRIKIITSTLTTEIKVEEIVPIAWLSKIGIDASFNIKVYATNNGHDEEPVWEDVTAETLNGEIYQFQNLDKQDSEWGIALKVEIDTL